MAPAERTQVSGQCYSSSSRMGGGETWGQECSLRDDDSGSCREVLFPVLEI